jgi:hypothetical protein
MKRSVAYRYLFIERASRDHVQGKIRRVGYSSISIIDTWSVTLNSSCDLICVIPEKKEALVRLLPSLHFQA